METLWSNTFTGTDRDDDSGVHTSIFTNNLCNICDINTSNSTTITTTTTTVTATPYDNNYINPTANMEASVVHALLLGMPDPHMMCLKLGKRHYYDDASVRDCHLSRTEASPYAVKRGSRWQALRVTSSTKCQVEGCHVALVGGKEYYKRHKVCEIHSKAPMVVVLGRKQRFCQQCSRFHDVIEFDEAKRSCRRRLEGHNLRRRKGTLHNENSSMMKRRFEPLSTSSPSMSPSQLKPVCALSLLSSPKPEPWMSSSDLSSRCSAALYELIAANRATSVSRHFINQNSSHQPNTDNTTHISHDTQMWDRFGHTAMRLDLKQAPALDFGLRSLKEKAKDPEEWTDYCWSSFGGTNVV